MWGELSAAIAELARDDVAGRVESRLEAGEDAQAILAELLMGGGVITPELKEWLSADFRPLDAAEALAYCVERAGGE